MGTSQLPSWHGRETSAASRLHQALRRPQGTGLGPPYSLFWAAWPECMAVSIPAGWQPLLQTCPDRGG